MRVNNIYVAIDHSFKGRFGQEPADHPMQKVAEVECVAGSGLRGDRYFDYKPDYKGQVTLFSQEVIDDLCTRFQLSDLDPWVFRRNIIVEGVDLNALIGEEFEVQGVRFMGTEEAEPCFWMNEAVCAGAEEAMRGHGGLRARILTDGVLRAEGAATSAGA